MKKRSKNFNKLILGIFLIMVFATGVLRIVHFFKDRQKIEIEIGGRKLFVQVAKTPERRALGLSGREALGDNEGMLFVFNEAGKPSFWMHGMLFPLDFIWIRGKEVRDISPNVPKDYPGLLIPREDIDKVLEVNAGFIKKYNVKIGDKVVIDNK